MFQFCKKSGKRNLFADRNLDNRNFSAGRSRWAPLRCMTFLVLEFDGDCHTSVRYFFAMTRSDGPPNSNLSKLSTFNWHTAGKMMERMGELTGTGESDSGIYLKNMCFFAIKCQKALAICAKAVYNNYVFLWKVLLCRILREALPCPTVFFRA